MYLWNQGTPGSEVEYTLLKVGATWNQTFNGSLFICVKTGQAKNFENTSELFLTWKVLCFRSSHPEVFMKKGVLKICSKFTGEHLCRSVISIKLFCSFIEIKLRHGCSPVNFWHIFRTSFPINTSGRLLLKKSLEQEV